MYRLKITPNDMQSDLQFLATAAEALKAWRMHPTAKRTCIGPDGHAMTEDELEKAASDEKRPFVEKLD